MAIQIIDAESLDKIPADRRSSAESYFQTDILYDEQDEADGLIPFNKSIGDVRIPSHTRYRVSWDKDKENEELKNSLAALEARIAALESS